MSTAVLLPPPTRDALPRALLLTPSPPTSASEGAHSAVARQSIAIRPAPAPERPHLLLAAAIAAPPVWDGALPVTEICPVAPAVLTADARAPRGDSGPLGGLPHGDPRNPAAGSARGCPSASDPAQVSGSLAHVAAEALRAIRPLAQLARWVTPEVYQQLADRLGATPPPRRLTRRARVLRVRVCRLGERIAEASVVVDDGVRVRAIALRLELRRGQWRATALELD